MKNLIRGFGEISPRFLKREVAGENFEEESSKSFREELKDFFREVERENKIDTQKELLERLFDNPKVKPPRDTQRDIYLQDEWQKRFSNPKGPHYAGLIRGWERMKNSKLPDGRTHLQMIYDECKSAGVPFEVAFQALHESLWSNKAASHVGAGGAWQFMPATARAYGLKVSKYTDDRKNWTKSTRAGVKYMRDLYDLTKKWDDNLSVSDRSMIDDEDRWLFAMWHYNRGGRVKATFLQTKGQSEKYTTYCYSDNRKYGKHESARYVNKIFATRAMLEEYERGTNRAQEREILAVKKKSSKADTQFGEWLIQKDSFTTEQNRLQLQKIRAQYQKESGDIHPAQYVKNALAVVDEKLALYAAVTPMKVQEARENTEKRGLSYYRENKKNWSSVRCLGELEKISDQYGKDLENGVRSDNETRRIFVDIRREQADVLRELVQTKEFEDRNIKIAISDDGEFEVKVDRRDPTTGEVNTINADIADHVVKPGDTLKAIAIRLSGHAMVSGTVHDLLKALNPELKKDNYILTKGATIRVPGQYVEVPNKKLSDLVREWYPGRTEEETATAIGYIKFLNGMHPERDRIRPGDVILVPVIRDVPNGASKKSNSPSKKVVPTPQKSPEKKVITPEKLKKSVSIGKGGSLQKAVENASWNNGKVLKTDAEVRSLAVRIEQYVGTVFGSKTVQPTDRVMVGKDKYGVYAKFQRSEDVSGPLRVK